MSRAQQDPEKAVGGEESGPWGQGPPGLNPSSATDQLCALGWLNMCASLSLRGSSWVKITPTLWASVRVQSFYKGTWNQQIPSLTRTTGSVWEQSGLFPGWSLGAVGGPLRWETQPSRIRAPGEGGRGPLQRVGTCSGLTQCWVLRRSGSLHTSGEEGPCQALRGVAPALPLSTGCIA